MSFRLVFVNLLSFHIFVIILLESRESLLSAKYFSCPYNALDLRNVCLIVENLNALKNIRFEGSSSSNGNTPLSASCDGSLTYLNDEIDNWDAFTSNDMVANQYENLPYPGFSSANISNEESHYKQYSDTPSALFPSHTLEKLNHYLHGGRENFRNFFRLVVAGGGTGGITVFMGEQLNHTNGEIIYIDFSKTSMSIAQKRARIRNLGNIIWIHSWIEEFRFLGTGYFSELQCSGVLHHLKKPSYGLNILKDGLTKSAGMNVMVYAKYGRTAVYQTQYLLRMINSYVNDIDKELANAKHLLDMLPNHNWFSLYNINGDHKKGKEGIYDLLLHKRDVSFSIENLFGWMVDAGLHFVDFECHKKRINLQSGYAISNSALEKAISHLHQVTKLCISELLRGNFAKHDFYASKMKNSVPDIHDMSNVLYLYGNPHGLRAAISKNRNRRIVGNDTFFVASMYRTNIQQLNANVDNIFFQKHSGSSGLRFGWKLNAFNDYIINKILDSNKGIKLSEAYWGYSNRSTYTISEDALLNLLKEFYEYVKDTELFLLKKEYVLPFPKTAFFNFIQVKSL